MRSSEELALAEWRLREVPGGSIQEGHGEERYLAGLAHRGEQDPDRVSSEGTVGCEVETMRGVWAKECWI